jgi:preprotein translocase subunit YajC
VGQYSSILLIVVMIFAFYFLIIRPQRKRQQQQADMVKTLTPGARVVTNTGIYGTVVAVGEKQLVLQTSPDSQIILLKQAVGRVVDENEEDAELSDYRSGTAVAGPATAAPLDPGYADDGGMGDEPVDDSAEPSGTSGMAGGAPIQEYTPGSRPDFSAPQQPGGPDTHQTSPWPAEGQHVSGSDSSLNGTGDHNDTREDEESDDDRSQGR